MILITPSKICGSDLNPIYSDKIDHDELGYAIICPNLLVIYFLSENIFFPKILILTLWFPGIDEGERWV